MSCRGQLTKGIALTNFVTTGFNPLKKANDG